jgi:hypothetical protein
LEQEYLTVAEVAQRLKIAAKTVRNRMASGIYQRGVHYFCPPGSRPRFKWSAVVAWQEGQQTADQSDETEDRIRMAAGYFLGEPPRKNKIQLPS